MSPLSLLILLCTTGSEAAYVTNPTPAPPQAVLNDRWWPYPTSGGSGSVSWPKQPTGSANEAAEDFEAELGEEVDELYSLDGAGTATGYEEEDQGYRTSPVYLTQPTEKDTSRVLSRKRRKHGRPLPWTMHRLCEERGQCTCYSAKTHAAFCCDCEWGSCFPAAALVTMATGETRSMHQLTTGDRVMTVSDDGSLTPTAVLGFLDRRPLTSGEYLHLHLNSGHVLRLSTNHVTFTREGGGTYAGEVRVGDELHVAQGNSTGFSRVTHVSYSIMQGAYVPLTEHGTLLVDGVLASNYASFPHSLSHAAVAPFRAWPGLLSEWFSLKQKNVLVGTLKRLAKLFVGAQSGGVVRLSPV